MLTAGDARQAGIRSRMRKASTIVVTAKAELTHISTQTRHDVAASEARLAAAMPSAGAPTRQLTPIFQTWGTRRSCLPLLDPLESSRH